MTTASARTNSAGYAVSGMMTGIGESMCKTDHFRIETSNGGTSMFLAKGLYTLHHDSDGSKAVFPLGNLLSHPNDNIQLMAQYMFENGMGLSSVVSIYETKIKKRTFWEIRSQYERFRAVSGRVYARKLSGK